MYTHATPLRYPASPITSFSLSLSEEMLLVAKNEFIPRQMWRFPASHLSTHVHQKAKEVNHSHA
jgi:hypothetical protein